jgi:hypothetical protein
MFLFRLKKGRILLPNSIWMKLTQQNRWIADLFLVFNDAFELGNSIGSFMGQILLALERV